MDFEPIPDEQKDMHEALEGLMVGHQANYQFAPGHWGQGEVKRVLWNGKDWVLEIQVDGTAMHYDLEKNCIMVGED